MKYSKILVLINPLLIFLLLEIFFYDPSWVYYSLPISALLLILTTHQFGRLWRYKKWWELSILPILFIGGVAIYSMLLASQLLVQFLFVLTLLFTFYYLRNVYFYFKDPGKNGVMMQNFSSYGNFLIVFFVAATVFGLHSLLNVSIWLLVSIFAVIILLVLYEVMTTNEIPLPQGGIFIIIFTFVLLQIIGSIYFLPLNYNILGLAVAICYYVLIGLLKFHLKGTLNKGAIQIYLTFGLGGLLLILLTASWR